jgi:acetyl-CoA carboxylase carboxyl transferase alpha subunit
MPNPESYRKSIRFMKQAEKFNRPVITFIDTKGAYPGVEAEEKGQGEAIAKSMLTLANLHVPVLCFVIGEGSSGGALALGVGNKVYMLENAIYSILSPEGFASILWKDSKRSKEAAEKMKLTSEDLKSFGVIDEIIKEPKKQEYDDVFIKKIANEMRKKINDDLKELNKMSLKEIKEQRYEKFRRMGC